MLFVRCFLFMHNEHRLVWHFWHAENTVVNVTPAIALFNNSSVRLHHGSTAELSSPHPPTNSGSSRHPLTDMECTKVWKEFSHLMSCITGRSYVTDADVYG
eukprot:Blabericola_migrator_1__7113@NODE_35_length_17941_cov_94_946347_g31_i0_p19_GENE_NODE_35_length_17941_cov_94_946347_g31_i0NODE_35_length_17941_cov_94_946347_g31_i0_p19_ORF_typecomplete_len101_score1_37_NODE_35_length_17941_cov_94_946347_g31_i01200012302